MKMYHHKDRCFFFLIKGGSENICKLSCNYAVFEEACMALHYQIHFKVVENVEKILEESTVIIDKIGID